MEPKKWKVTVLKDETYELWGVNHYDIKKQILEGWNIAPTNSKETIELEEILCDRPYNPEDLRPKNAGT